MKKPELQIRKWTSSQVPGEAVCSSCQDKYPFFVSARPGNRETNMAELQDAFARHFKEVHLREDASQAAARIVREATENH
jgi:hypothetical protein